MSRIQVGLAECPQVGCVPIGKSLQLGKDSQQLPQGALERRRLICGSLHVSRPEQPQPQVGRQRDLPPGRQPSQEIGCKEYGVQRNPRAKQDQPAPSCTRGIAGL